MKDAGGDAEDSNSVALAGQPQRLVTALGRLENTKRIGFCKQTQSSNPSIPKPRQPCLRKPDSHILRYATNLIGPSSQSPHWLDVGFDRESTTVAPSVNCSHLVKGTRRQSPCGQSKPQVQWYEDEAANRQILPSVPSSSSDRSLISCSSSNKLSCMSHMCLHDCLATDSQAFASQSSP